MRKLALLLLLVGVGRGEGYESPAYKRLKAVAAQMAKVGMPVDMTRVSLRVDEPRRGGRIVESPIGRQGATQDDATEFLEKSWATGGSGRGVEAWAYYLPREQRIVFHAIGVGGLIGGDDVAAHELVHAWQHQRDAEVFQFRSATTEHSNIRQFLQEGEAQLGSLLFQLQRQGTLLADARLDATDATIRAGLVGPGASMPYRSGFRFAAEQAHRHGVDRMAAWARKTPTSTEQIVHPTKVGRDLPTPITFPVIPDVRCVRMDILGEVEFYRILASRSHLEQAMRAAIGWDGDDLRVYRTENKKLLTVWIAAWDREVDAEQVCRQLDLRWRGVVWREGRATYWVHSPDLAARNAAVAACRAHKLTVPVDADAATTTRRIEDAWLADFQKARRIHKKRWRLGSIPVSILVPQYWNIESSPGGAFLQSYPKAKRSVSIVVETWPMAAFGDMDKLAEHLQRKQHALHWMRLDKISRLTRPDAILIERTPMWGKRVLRHAFCECYVNVRGTLVHYVAKLESGTPKELRRDVWFALRSVQVTD